MKILFLTCEILYREACFVTARSQNQVDLLSVHKGLHDIGAEGMSSELAQKIASLDLTSYDALVLGYALCSGGVEGLTASIPLVIPRAHDCITLLLGDKERYRDYFDANPGTYFCSTGWIERGSHLDQGAASNSQNEKAIQNSLGCEMTHAELVEKYGEENAAFLAAKLPNLTEHYNRLAYIDTGVGDQSRFIEQTEKDAAEKEWDFDLIQGDLQLLQDLVDGNWNAERFLVVSPGEKIVRNYSEALIIETQEKG